MQKLRLLFKTNYIHKFYENILQALLKIENPWTIQSIYDLQYFNCPTCEYKNHSKQEFINHTFESHPYVVGYLEDIKDGSLNDIVCPWNLNIKSEIIDTKEEPEFYNDDNEPFETSSENIVVKDKVKKIRQKVKEHPCLKCNEIFPSRRKMREHILTNHAGDGLKDVRCNLCGKNFYDSSGLKIHLANVHGAEKKFKCDRCDKTFAQRCHLRVHISTVHEGQKKYKCEECGKAYTEPRNLKIHIESKHQGVKKCQCDKCDYR